METIGKCTRLAAVLVGIAALVLAGLVVPAGAQQPITPPDLTVCNGIEACDAPEVVCKAGFQVTLTGFTPATTQNSGTATYTYQVCSPPAGDCQGGTGLRAGESCLQNSFCQQKGTQTDPEATCNRTCATNTFQDLSHFDVTFPALGGVGSCLGSGTQVTGTCTAIDNTPTDGHTASVGAFGLGDGSCFTPTSPVAKCDNTDINPGDCITMTVSIAGENTGLGLGAAIVVDKEGNTCTSACMQGPSCEPCEQPPDGEACLTRTIGFWGTHPWITNNYDPVTVCGKPLDCSGADDGKSNPACLAGSCTSIMEGLGSIPSELKGNEAYVTLVRQLTAAKLNLNATGALTGNAGQCSSFNYQGMSIQQWITSCETLCNANKSTISSSGCIEALNAFNNSQDTGFAQTPPPFDRPSVDDHGNVSGADPSAFTAAQGNSNPPGKWVIGKNVGGHNCQ
jgi:hypothetical protein